MICGELKLKSGRFDEEVNRIFLSAHLKKMKDMLSKMLGVVAR